jgi:hypothetical protein
LSKGSFCGQPKRVTQAGCEQRAREHRQIISYWTKKKNYYKKRLLH